MPATPVTLEVRYRLDNSNAPWTVKTFPADSTSIRLTEGVARGQAYDVEARYIGDNGVPSAWVPQAVTVANPSTVPLAPTGLTALGVADGVALKWAAPDLQPGDVEYVVERSANGSTGWTAVHRTRATGWTDPLVDETVWWYRVKAESFAGVSSAYSNIVSENGVSIANVQAAVAAADAAADAAQASANAANAALADIASDSVLTPDEKPRVILDYDVIFGERPGIESQADAFGIVAEKAAYTTAYAALTSYLSGLTTPTTWNSLSGATTISGADFRTAFGNYYAARQALLNRVAARARALSTPSVVNSSFEEGDWGWTLGAGFATGINFVALDGIRVLSRAAAADSSAFNSAGSLQVSPGAAVRVTARVYRVDGNGTFQANVNFYDPTGGYITTLAAANFVPADGNFTWMSKTGVVIAPANAAFCRVGFSGFGQSSGTWLVDRVEQTLSPDSVDQVPHGTVYGRVSNSDLFDNGGVRRVGLRFGASGHRVGDARNLYQAQVNAYGSVRNTTALTATSAGAVSVNAFTFRNGSVSVPYSAVSNAVTGLTQNTRYVIYCFDDDFQGGTRTWYAGANPDAVMQLGNGVVIAGEVTIPTSGTSSGGGGSGPAGGGEWCVDADMLLACGARAGDVVAGQCIAVWNDDPDRPDVEWLDVESNVVVPGQPCHRLTSASGAVVIASDCTPMTLRDGRIVRMDAMAGEDVLVLRGGRLAWEPVAELVPVAPRAVAKIKVHQRCYFAGAERAATIATHNPVKP